MALSIKNMAGDIVSVDLSSIICNNYLATIGNLKEIYIRKCFEEYKEEIELDKLIFLDYNGNELRPNDKHIRKCSIKNGDSISSFIVSKYIDNDCLKMIPNNIPNDPKGKLKYNESLQISYKDKETIIDSSCLQPPYIYKAISEKPLTDDLSYFSLKFLYNYGKNISMCIGDEDIFISFKFNNIDSDLYSFKFDSVKMELYFISESGISKSLSLKERPSAFYIHIIIEHPGYRGNPIVSLRECKRKEVEKIENLYKNDL